MFFLQFILYLSSFVGTLKNEIPGAALELCQLKLKQFSPDILKFSTKHEVILLLSTVLWFLALICLYLMQARVDWVLIIFGTQVIKKKRSVWPVFPDYLSVSCDYGGKFLLSLRYWISKQLAMFSRLFCSISKFTWFKIVMDIGMNRHDRHE